MKPFAVLVFLGAFVISTQGYSKCDPKLLEKIQKKCKDSAIDLKATALLHNGESILADFTPGYFPPGINCAATKLEIDDTFKVTTVDMLGKVTKAPPTKMEEDDKTHQYYTKSEDGANVYSIPWFNENGIVGFYTCSDKEPKKLEDHIADAVIQIFVNTAEKDALKVLESKKKIVEKAKKVGCEEYKFNFQAQFVNPEECLKKIQEENKKKQ